MSNAVFHVLYQILYGTIDGTQDKYFINTLYFMQFIRYVAVQVWNDVHLICLNQHSPFMHLQLSLGHISV